MEIKCFHQKLDEDKARQSAMPQGGIFGRIMCFNKEISEVRLHYIENKIITLTITHAPTLLERLGLKKKAVKKQDIMLIADGSTGAVAVMDSVPEIISMNSVDENSIQLSTYSDDVILVKAKKTALRVIHRHIGGIPELEIKNIESIFRPYWLVFYGDFKEGKKVRCIPVPADGCGSHRTF